VPSGFEDGARQFGDLAVVLKQVGQDGLRRELYKAISDAAKPVADEIKSTAHLDPYLPNRYAAVLAAGLRVQTFKQAGVNPGVTIRATAPTPGGGRKIRQLDDGHLRHPVYGNRKVWRGQGAPSVLPGFFTDPCNAAAPRVRDAIGAAVDRVMTKASGGIG
jgi:hypothetical protein